MILLAATIVSSSVASAQVSQPLAGGRTGTWRQDLNDAWWTGPVLAMSPQALPKGHIYTEPYFLDVISEGHHQFASLAYLQYGVSDRFTLGLIPSFSLSKRRGRRVWAAGDFAVLGQVQLTHFVEGRQPALALVFRQSLPTGRFNGLAAGDEPSGAGAFASAVGLNGQHYFWLPNGRLLRGRVNLMASLPANARLRGRSAYGTAPDFRGKVHLGSSFSSDISLEYSATRRLVFAMEVAMTATGGRRLIPASAASGQSARLRATSSIAFIPAVEYSWSGNEGVIFGVRMVPRVGQSPSSYTPVIAFSRFW